MRNFTPIMLGFMIAVSGCSSQADNTPETGQQMQSDEMQDESKNMATESATDYKQIDFKTIDGGSTNLEAYDGQVKLIVNVASKCGYTPQYQGLEDLYRKFKDRNFVVLGFPANNFGNQEPGTNAEIKEFCTSKFDVTFPMMSKISVKGEDIHPLFAYLTANSDPPGDIQWNFNKFLLDKDGNITARWPSKVEPTSDEIAGEVERVLKQEAQKS